MKVVKWKRARILRQKQGCTQKVRVGGAYSASLDICCGVPQGSVLGPILFLLYINDMCCLGMQGKIIQYADDTTILWHGRDPELLKHTIVAELSLVRNWCAANRLVFNTEKTSIMGFRCDMSGIQLEDQGVLLEKPACKFLGLFVDFNLRFDNHILNLCIGSSRPVVLRLGWREGNWVRWLLVWSILL